MKLASLLLAVAAGASAAHPIPHPPTTPDALLDASANDFRAHDHVTAVRNVRFGHYAGGDGVTHALVCGDFRATDAWVPFVTIATSDYEQWLGAASEHWCTGPLTVLEHDDLSPALQARLERPR